MVNKVWNDHPNGSSSLECLKFYPKERLYFHSSFCGSSKPQIIAFTIFHSWANYLKNWRIAYKYPRSMSLYDIKKHFISDGKLLIASVKCLEHFLSIESQM